MDVAIIGGGIGGLATAVGLHKIGIKAHIYERTKLFKPLGAGIGIGSNVMLVLNKLGVSDDILRSGLSLKKQRFLNGKFKEMNSIDFTLLKKRFGEENITIERSDLHKALFTAIDQAYFHFNKRVNYFEQINDKVVLYFTDGTDKTVDFVIAADGIHSIFRNTLIPSSTPRFAGYTCWRGITKNHDDVFMHLSSEAWSRQGRFGFAPLHDGDVYWFACVNANENEFNYRNLDKSGVAELFKHFPPVVERLINETYDDYFLHHDIYDIKPIKTFVYNHICLLGDAAHATTPNMAQGAGQSIENAYVLMEALKSERNVSKAFNLYDKRRVKKTNKVIKLSRQIGWIAQWENPLLITFRNLFFPVVPKSLLFWRLTFLFK